MNKDQLFLDISQGEISIFINCVSTCISIPKDNYFEEDWLNYVC